jgi:uncharacterized protein YgiM (DUF1202 family)
MKKYSILTGMVFVFLCSMALAQSNMWVTSAGTKLKEQTKASSRTIQRLPIGTQVFVLAAKGRWYRVRTPSRTEGWVYGGKLSKHAPQKGTQGSGGLFSSLGGDDVSANEADTAQSIRGLSDETEEYAKNRRTPFEYRIALDHILTLNVNDTEIESFLSQGRIGEYAQ